MTLLCLQPYDVLKTETSKHTEQGLVHTLGIDGFVDINQWNRELIHIPISSYGEDIMDNNYY